MIYRFLISLSVFMLLPLTQAGCGQEGGRPAGKEQASKGLKTAPADGWREAVSEKGRFKVLFPGEPGVVDTQGLKGYEFRQDSKKRKWVAQYFDFGSYVNPSDAGLRKAYKDGFEVLTRQGAKLVRYREVSLNGRPGVEAIVVRPDDKSYMRTFQIRNRIYTLSVDDHADLREADEIPPDVQKFFDSFNYWE